jgi:hypothetical protein
MTMPPAASGLPPCWGVYVTVDDMDATAKLAVEMGGKVLMPPQDIPQVGRFCVLQDPPAECHDQRHHLRARGATGRLNDFVEGGSRAFLVLIY